ncbi:u3 small nucleolar RNA-associated protein 11 [Mycena albidolilacea]|uniref:U3 small nucleolar RNA-associated protein 11 n=1 Tax=Mycena albidolilacea TaxID=1033008 RepID=A0AAD7AKN1_9AGAR|nr:u3 small nucleolar RNA-associated protein 11 [Mycena albidolilacea]
MPLRNSIHRRNHKERSQLANRARLGILEKHKDYVKRARDYHSKQDRLTRLKQKVAERNKDEFYFSMSKQTSKGGVHVADRGNVALPQDIVKVLKTQDENYVRTMRTAGLKKIDKIKAQLTAMADLMKPGGLENDEDIEELEPDEIETLQDAGIIPKRKGKGRAPKHIVFVDNEDEARQYASSSRTTLDVPMQDSSTDADEPMDLGWKVPTKRSRRRDTAPSEDAQAVAEILSEERRELASANRKRLLKELSARLFRDTQLRYAEREFEMQRQLMGKGARKKIAGVEAVEGADDDEENEDEIDARRGKRRAPARKVVDAKTYKPRVYKWRLERKG